MTANLGTFIDGLDGALHISDEKSIAMVYELLDTEGLYVGASSALNVVAAVELAQKLGKGGSVSQQCREELSWTIPCRVPRGHRHCGRCIPLSESAVLQAVAAFKGSLRCYTRTLEEVRCIGLDSVVVLARDRAQARPRKRSLFLSSKPWQTLVVNGQQCADNPWSVWKYRRRRCTQRARPLGGKRTRCCASLKQFPTLHLHLRNASWMPRPTSLS